MSGGGYGQQQGQNWQNMGQGGGMGSQPFNTQPTPMQSAFAPSQGMGGPMPGATDQTGMAQDLSGKGWGTAPTMLGPDSAPTPDGFGGGPGYSLTGSSPLAGMATTNPVGMGTTSPGMGGGMGGPMPANMVQGGGMGSIAQPAGGGNPYQDYTQRRNNWIDQLRGFVAKPQPIGMGGGGGGMPKPQPKGPAGAAGGVDHMANLRALMGEDPRLANEYRLRNGDTINWWQQNQGNVASGLFGGDNGKMQEWLRGTSPTSSNAAPLSQAEMLRLNQMAGIRGPSWMR